MAHKPVPKYRRQKNKTGDRAFVELGGQRHYLGPFGSSESKERYHQLVMEWEANGLRTPAERHDITVNECISAHWRFAVDYYRKDGRPTTEVFKLRTASRALARLYGSTLARDFGPLRLKACRQVFIDAGNCRSVVNEQTFRLKRLFRWCVSEELVPKEIYNGLTAVQSLRRGRAAVHDYKPVQPAPDEFVDAIEPFVSRQV